MSAFLIGLVVGLGAGVVGMFLGVKQGWIKP
jgi:hypothetical protein